MNQQNISSTLSIFQKQIQNLTYSEKYQHWVQYLEKVQASSSEQYLAALTIFLQQFPFNYVYWISYVHYNNDLTSYQLALKKNSKSFQLWSAYLFGLKNSKADPAKYKKQIQRAILQIGADTRSISFYEQYYTMISQNFRYEFYKKIVTRALIGLQDIFDKFKHWLNELNQSQINLFYTKQLKGALSLNSQLTLQIKKAYLYDQIERIYLKTIKYREERVKIEQKIQRYYFDGTEQQRQELVFWRQLLDLERKNGIIQNISYCYQRSLMAQTQNHQLWDQAFHYLQHETNKYAKVLSILRNNKRFFMKFSKEIYFYWCDLQQRQDVSKSRSMYKQLCETLPSLRTYQRYIQFQIRQKGYAVAKDLYDSLLSMYSTDNQTLSYVLIEYSRFVIKYYKDYQYPKKLLKSYFDYLPYNSYLLIEYLQFMQHFQNNQGFYDQLMVILCDAIKKAKKSLRESEFIEATKMIKYYLRSVLGSIYLIKLSQRRIMEVEQNLELKKQDLIPDQNDPYAHQQDGIIND